MAIRHWATLATLALGAACRAVPPDSPQDASPLPAARHGPRWIVKPYLFAAGMDGSVGIAEGSQEVDADFEDVLDSLDLGAMLSVELQPQASPWSFLTDLMYVALEERGTAPGPLGLDVEGEVEQFVWELAAAYAVKPAGRLDLLGGVRYWDLSSELTVGAPSGDISSEDTQQWLDPLVGVRSRLPLDGRVDLVLRADVGGFGVGSDVSYQLGAGVDWSFTEDFRLVVGYRHLDVDFDHDGFEYDMATSGPLVGLMLGF